MDDRHLAWKEEGMPDSLEWCGVFPFVFFLSHLCRKVLGRDPRERKGLRLKLAWVQGTAHSNQFRRTYSLRFRPSQDGMQNKRNTYRKQFCLEC